MDVKVIARLSGVSPESVVDHQQVKGADILRIDLRKEPGLRRSIEARAARSKQLPDGDIFTATLLVDGSGHTFQAEHMDKHRTYDFVQPGPGEPRIPAWRLRAEVYSPDALYGAVIERIGFLVFDRHSGSTYDLSTPNEHMTRPNLMYSIGYLDDIDHLRLIGVSATAGNFEVNHVPDGENRMDLSGAFIGVRFAMPNAHEHFPQAPDREFTVQLDGHYQLIGTW